MPAGEHAGGVEDVSANVRVRGVEGLRAVTVLIPAWQPEPRLVPLVAELLARGLGRVVVVDDGSEAGCVPVFDGLRSMKRTTVLRHEVNRGKGRALKTGLEHILQSSEGSAAVVTADADGQHLPEDIVRVAETLLSAGERPVLGTRAFAGDVPLRSRLGNLLTRRLFRVLTGTAVRDTQTGLRGFPRAALPLLLALPGERYEYEMTVLAHLCRNGVHPLEVPIETVYLEENRGSHFDPIRDSLRIYGVLLRTALPVNRLTPRGVQALSIQRSEA